MGLAAVDAGLPLLTADEKALPAYAAIGAQVEVLKAGRLGLRAMSPRRGSLAARSRVDGGGSL